MSRIWTLARKDLLETRRDRLSAIFIVIMPIAFTAFFGIMFGSGSDRLAVAVHDADRGEQSRALVAALEGSDAVRVVPKSAAELDPWIADGRAAAGLLIPPGFSAAVQAGEPAELVIVSDQTSSGAQAIAAEVRAAAGDLVAADDVQLELPETGVCSVDLASPDLTGGSGACCGGPPKADATACCVLDEVKKNEGEAGCGCGTKPAAVAASPVAVVAARPAAARRATACCG